MSTRSGSEAAKRTTRSPTRSAAAPAAGGVRTRRLAGRPPFWEVHRTWLDGADAADEERAARAGARPVVLIHAATLGRRMFLEPDGGFAAHLLRQRDGGRFRFDVYTLDWRSSNLLFGPAGECLEGPHRPADATSCYRLDRTAEEDLPEGLAAVARARPDAPLSLVAHCMGAAAVAQALACRRIGCRDDGQQPALDRIVLSTIALFYRLGVDGWLKVADNIVAELESEGVPFLSPHREDPALHPRCRWPDRFESMFETWRSSLFSHGCRASFCDRLWFLYGGDYRADDMMDLHDASGAGGLEGHFGAMPIGLYRHIVENCRRGWAARWEVSPRSHPYELLSPDGFRGQDVTLITGGENQVWHRDSIDRMYEWLQRTLGRAGPGRPVTRMRKRVFDRFGHVDLWWSSRAPGEVFPFVSEVLAA
jgi:hypothetical protein